MLLTAHAVALVFAAEAVVVPIAAAIQEPHTQAPGGIETIRGDGCTAGSRRDWFQTVTETGALILLHTPVSQLHCPMGTLTTLCVCIHVHVCVHE